MSVLQIVLVIVLAILVFGFLYETYAQARDRRRYPAPGRFVDVGGYRLHVQVMGEGQPGPTVILDAGMVSFSSNWAWVQSAVATAAPTLAIDRAGFGWSDRGPKPRSAGQSARELHAALEKLNLPRPYVLVGHSYGGMTARAYASLYRDEVAGMVLVDASHPDQWVRMGLPSKAMGSGSYVFSFLARFGLLHLWSTEYRLLANGLPPRQYGELMAYTRISRALATGEMPLSPGTASVGRRPSPSATWVICRSSSSV
ncbi:MAG: alpha/beta fold hydrolase [Chloroflexi bacterium]|nr:alpha/beta fold hydrolase [Chloroflexota bacterium]